MLPDCFLISTIGYTAKTDLMMSLLGAVGRPVDERSMLGGVAVICGPVGIPGTLGTLRAARISTLKWFQQDSSPNCSNCFKKPIYGSCVMASQSTEVSHPSERPPEHQGWTVLSRAFATTVQPAHGDDSVDVDQGAREVLGPHSFRKGRMRPPGN